MTFVTDDSIFRVVTIALFIIVVTIGGYHRIGASRSREKISRREEGFLIMVLLRLFGFSAWGGLLVYMADPRWMAWSTFVLPAWLRWIGAVFGIVAIPLVYWTFRSLGKNVTDTVAIRGEHSLVTQGPYRWVRHPLYSFGTLLFIGFILLSANWFIGLTGVLALVLLIVRAGIEEEKLIEKFGDDYREYMKRTGRFIPRLTRTRK